MNCPTCKLAYTKALKPMVLGCGHTFCQKCIQSQDDSKCPRCQQSSKPVINFAIYQQIANQSLKNIDKYIKVCLFGSMDVGKTSILNRLVDNQFQFKTSPTIGVDFKYVDKQIDGLVNRFQLWDSAGQEKYRSMCSQHMKGSDIILLLYDLTCPSSINSLTYWFHQIQKECNHNNIIVIANKTDLLKTSSQIQASTQQQKMSSDINIHGTKKPSPITKQEQKQIKQRKWLHLRTSCYSTEGINDVWQAIIKFSKCSKGTSKDQKKSRVILSKADQNKTKGKTCWQRFKQYF